MGLASIDPPIFFCAFSMQNTPGGSETHTPGPRATFVQNKKFCTQNVFLGLCDATSPCKNLVKNWENELAPSCDSEAIFSAASAVFEGGGEESGVGDFNFLAMQGQTSHVLPYNLQHEPAVVALFLAVLRIFPRFFFMGLKILGHSHLN
jgi:hypothetical protein